MLLSFAISSIDRWSSTCSSHNLFDTSHDEYSYLYKQFLLDILFIDLPRITQSFNNISQLASLSVNVSCTAEGTLPIKWIWRKNAVQLEQSSNVQFNETGAVSTLTINSLDINDSSIVQCVAYSDNYRYMSAANNDLLVQSKNT